jgi:hypothetical protein
MQRSPHYRVPFQDCLGLLGIRVVVPPTAAYTGREAWQGAGQAQKPRRDRDATSSAERSDCSLVLTARPADGADLPEDEEEQ